VKGWPTIDMLFGISVGLFFADKELPALDADQRIRRVAGLGWTRGFVDIGIHKRG
jgi:hypothetical protein